MEQCSATQKINDFEENNLSLANLAVWSVNTYTN